VWAGGKVMSELTPRQEEVWERQLADKGEECRQRLGVRKSLEDHINLYDVGLAAQTAHGLTCGMNHPDSDLIIAVVAALWAQNKAMRAALEGWESWEADILENAQWDTSSGCPLLTQEQMDALTPLQYARNEALSRFKKPEQG
jgi:hypothetical protein